MPRCATILLLALLACASVPAVRAQAAPTVGSILIQGKPVGKLSLARKRFFLFRGGLAENAPLIDRIKNAKPVSRDCYYASAKASACFVAWLQQENCETPFCRVVKKEDIASVKEFQDAYARGMNLYGQRADLALSWLLSNMSQSLITGYYSSQKKLIDEIVGDARPVQSIMTTSTAADATFAGLVTGAKPAKYLLSNLIPVEVGTKSYVWTCEVDVSPGGQTKQPLYADAAKTKKNCVLTVRDLPSCTVGTCVKK